MTRILIVDDEEGIRRQSGWGPTQILRSADGKVTGYRINGTKQFITSGQIAGAVIIAAVTGLTRGWQERSSHPVVAVAGGALAGLALPAAWYAIDRARR